MSKNLWYTNIDIVTTQLNGFHNYQLTLLILLNVNHSFSDSEWFQVLYIDLRPGRAVKIGNAPV